MAFANRYGINLGEIYETVDRLKTAEQLRKKRQMEMDKEAGTTTGMYNAIKNADGTTTKTVAKKDGKGTNVLTTKTPGNENTIGGEAMAISAASNNDKAETQETKNALTKTDKEPTYKEMISEISKFDTQQKIKKQKQADEKLRNQFEGRKKLYEMMGYAGDQAEVLAGLDVKEVKEFMDMAETKTEQEQKVLLGSLIKGGNDIQKILDLGIKDPEAADKMFIQMKQDRLKMLNELRKKGMKKQADELEKELKKMPDTILKKDGKLNTEFLNRNLLNITAKMQTLEPYKTTEQQRKKDFEDYKAQRKRKDRLSNRKKY